MCEKAVLRLGALNVQRIYHTVTLLTRTPSSCDQGCEDLHSDS